MNLYAALLPADLDRRFLDLSPLGATGGHGLTYREFDDRVRRFSAVLTGSTDDGGFGLGVGDRLVVQVDKSADALALILASVRSGLVFVPLNTAYTPAEVRYFVDDAEASLIVCGSDRLDALTEALGDITISTLDADGGGTIAEAADSTDPTTDDAVGREPLDPAAMLYTSGTTGRSKGAVLTHAGLLSNAEALRDTWQITADDAVCHTLPIFHVHGLFVAIFPLMLESARVRFRPRFDVDDVLTQLGDSTVLMGVPTHYVRLLADERFDADRCASLRLFTSGSAPMTEQTHAEFTARTDRHIVERYGMTETGILTSNRLGAGGQVAGTVGHALPGHEVRVVDDDGRPVEAGVSGAVEVTLPVPFGGYWRQPDKTAETITTDGWFRTGDVGLLDETGRLTLDGRASDMIISGGYNVYPKEIELVLDAVAGVDESAVVGVPHPDFGEGVIAVVALEPGATADTVRRALETACADELARFKHPKRYLFVDALPRNAMAKVQKKELRVAHAEVFSS